jgi:hypothetical protein
MHAIIHHVVVAKGAEWYRKLTKEQAEAQIALKPTANLPRGFCKGNSEHRAVVLGMVLLNVGDGHVDKYLSDHAETRNFISKLVSQDGPQPELRMPAELVWEIVKGTGISWLEFAALAAIRSKIGAKKYPVRITRQVIQCRMLGYKSTEIMERELANRTDGLKPLTFRQINYILDKLDERKFFARARADHWHTYYSHRMTQAQLEDMLVQGKSYAQGFHERRKQRNADLMQRIKGKPAIKVDNTIEVDTTPANCPQSVHRASTPLSTPLSTGVSTLIPTLVIAPLVIAPQEIPPQSNNGAAALLDSQKENNGNGEMKAMVSALAQKLTPQCGIPRLPEVEAYLMSCFDGAIDFAEPFYKRMEKQHWKDKSRKPINDWKAMAKAYASKAWFKRSKATAA